MEKTCFKCKETNTSVLLEMFGYTICNSCKSKMGLFQDKTLKKYIVSFEEAKKLDPDNPTFAEEISRRLAQVEKDYISKKIKLLYVQDKLGDFFE